MQNRPVPVSLCAADAAHDLKLRRAPPVEMDLMRRIPPIARREDRDHIVDVVIYRLAAPVADDAMPSALVPDRPTRRAELLDHHARPSANNAQVRGNSWAIISPTAFAYILISHWAFSSMRSVRNLSQFSKFALARIRE